MCPNNDYIYDAGVALEQITGLGVNIESRRKEYDGIIDINGNSFTIEARNELRKENKGFLLTRLEQINTMTKRPTLVIAKYIALELALELKKMGINYLDVAGNCYVKNKDLILYVSGQKVIQKEKVKQTKAFQEAGIKIIFNLLSNPDNLQLSYRELAELSDVSIGSVSNVMKELEDQSFILKTKLKRLLKNKPLLLERWVVAFQDVLRPKLVKKQMRFTTLVAAKNWQALGLEKDDGSTLWGGEPAAALLTNQLTPEKFSIYTMETWQSIGQDFELVPDVNGTIEILQVFWKTANNTKLTVPALLVYADLIGSGYSRNIEMAKLILETDLKQIKSIN